MGMHWFRWSRSCPRRTARCQLWWSRNSDGSPLPACLGTCGGTSRTPTHPGCTWSGKQPNPHCRRVEPTTLWNHADSHSTVSCAASVLPWRRGIVIAKFRPPPGNVLTAHDVMTVLHPAVIRQDGTGNAGRRSLGAGILLKRREAHSLPSSSSDWRISS